MWPSRIAARYLWTARKQRHIAFLSTISILGLAIGVFALLISIALLSGLQDQIKARLMESSPHLLIEPAGSNDGSTCGVCAVQGLAGSTMTTLSRESVNAIRVPSGDQTGASPPYSLTCRRLLPSGLIVQML